MLGQITLTLRIFGNENCSGLYSSLWFPDNKRSWLVDGLLDKIDSEIIFQTTVFDYELLVFHRVVQRLFI